MIWMILAVLGVPLWLCAVGITVIVYRTRSLTRRGGHLHSIGELQGRLA